MDADLKEQNWSNTEHFQIIVAASQYFKDPLQ